MRLLTVARVRLRWCIAAWAICSMARPAGEVRFLTFAEAQEVLAAFGRTEDAAKWDNWVRSEDRDVRARINRGIEDSISNLLLYGTSFTRLPRMESAETAINSTGEIVDAARARVRAAAAVLAHPVANERLRFARDFLLRRQVQPGEMEALLATNLARFALEQRGYQEKLKSIPESADPSEVRFVRATLFEQRGLSVDTSLLPNYALEDTLRAMLRRGALTPGCIRRIGIIGPGLDFSDKHDGYDFYPLQSIQPCAVLEAVLRLGLAQADGLAVVTCDLNPAVNAHLKGMAERARAGQSYVLQLPRNKAADWTGDAIAYWAHFGETIGSPVSPAAAPEGLTIRAVAVRPRYAAMIEPVDLNVVGQFLDPAPGSGFDLVVATNILVYYDNFQQALALAAIARMMNSQGVFLSNTVLPAQRSSLLEYLGRRSVEYSVSGAYGDDVVVYRRR